LGPSPLARRRSLLIEAPAELLIRATGILTVLLLFGILALLTWQGLQLFLDRDYSIERFITYPNTITDNTTDPSAFRFGILPPLVATLWVTFVCLLIAIPIGLLTAIYISEVAPPRLRLIIKSMAELLAGVPTVVFAFVGLAIVVPRIQEEFGWGAGGLSGATAGLVVAFVAIPLIVSIADDALQAVPHELKENAFALGCNRMQCALFVMVPSALSGITAAVMLGMARAIGETMIVLVLAGGNSTLPHDPTESMRPMTATIASGFGNASQQSLIRPALYMTGLVLFVLTFITTWIADLVLERQRRKYS
jgi:phosphate transport system permease protein